MERQNMKIYPQTRSAAILFRLLPATGVLAAAVLAVALLSGPVTAHAVEPDSYTLGETRLQLKGPAKHSWINKKTFAALLLVPERYKGLAGHALAFYSPGSINKPTRMYDNHAALFHLGPQNKSWTKEDFALMKAKLMPGKADRGQEAVKKGEQFLRQFLDKQADYAVSTRRAKKYYKRLQQAEVLHDAQNAVVLAYRHKKKGKRDKYVTLSLCLVRDKVIGTAYYQVDPGGKERERSRQLTLDWQKSILDANGAD